MCKGRCQRPWAYIRRSQHTAQSLGYSPFLPLSQNPPRFRAPVSLCHSAPSAVSRNHPFEGHVDALIDALGTRGIVIAMKRVAFYVRVSTADGQSTENQIRALHDVAARSGWNVVAIFCDDGVSGAKGRDRRPGLDALLKAVTRREVDLVAAWAVDRLGRSLPDLVALLGELQARGVDLFLHQQALDTSTPTGRMMFQMLGVFAEFERSLIRSRVLAGLERTRAKGTRLGRPPLEADKAAAIRSLLASGVGIRETARRTGVGASTVQRMGTAVATEQGADAAA